MYHTCKVELKTGYFRLFERDEVEGGGAIKGLFPTPVPVAVGVDGLGISEGLRPGAEADVAATESADGDSTGDGLKKACCPGTVGAGGASDAKWSKEEEDPRAWDCCGGNGMFANASSVD